MRNEVLGAMVSCDIIGEKAKGIPSGVVGEHLEKVGPWMEREAGVIKCDQEG